MYKFPKLASCFHKSMFHNLLMVDGQRCDGGDGMKGVLIISGHPPPPLHVSHPGHSSSDSTARCHNTVITILKTYVPRHRMGTEVSVKIEETHRRGKIVLVVQEAKHSIKGVVRRKLEHAGLNSILAASIQCIVYISILLPLPGRLYKMCVRKCEHRVSVCNLMCVF